VVVANRRGKTKRKSDVASDPDDDAPEEKAPSEPQAT
jgi:hypothetical protein